MIPLLPIKINALNCSRIVVTDTTDYSVSEDENYSLDLFTDGIRIIRITYPDGTIALYSTFNLNTQMFNPFFSNPLVENPNPIDLGVNIIDTTITSSNNTNASWEFDLSSQEGEYTIDIISIPLRFNFPFNYTNGSALVFLDDNENPVIGFNVKLSNISGYFVYTNLKADLSEVSLCGGYAPSPWTCGQTAQLSPLNINSITFTVDCNIEDSIECIFAKYQESFCEGCGCDDICKNKKSNNILKATLLLRELELLEDNQTEYQKKLELYTPVLRKLCQCS